MASGERITLPAPVIESLMSPSDKWTREYQAFRRLLPELLPARRGQYVAIHEGRVIASGPDKLPVALEAFRRIGNVSIHVGLVSEDTEPVVRSGVRRIAPSNGGVPWLAPMNPSSPPN
jgi:hypothetical protein